MPTTFNALGLDARLWKSIAKMGFVRPTLIQEHTIPIALTGSDVLLRGRTGSGKSLAFLIPTIQNILNMKLQNVSACAIVLAPTRDLCRQLTQVLNALLHFSYDLIAAVNLEGRTSSAPLPRDLSHILVGTPASVLTFLKAPHDLNLKVLIVDEADLVLSYGYTADLHELITLLPSRALQTILVSATLNVELDALKSLILRKPAIVKLNEEDGDDQDLKQFYIKTAYEDKCLVLFALLKLGPIAGKTLIFVQDVTSAFQLKLFLEAFSIRNVVLNSELPINSRTEIIHSFNRGLFDYLITTDNSMSTPTTGSKSKKANDDSEFNAARGIDFENVANIINFDVPSTVSSYVHRVGRVARAGHSGNAFTLLTAAPEVTTVWEKICAHYTIGNDDGDDDEMVSDCDIKELVMDAANVHAFKYRVDDVLNSISTKAVKEARLSQLKEEIVNSDMLQSHFEDHPRELSLLHDRILRPKNVKSHLTVVPKYLLPNAAEVHHASLAEPVSRVRNIVESRMNKRDRFRLKHQRKLNNPLKLNRKPGPQIKKHRSKKQTRKRK